MRMCWWSNTGSVLEQGSVHLPVDRVVLGQRLICPLSSGQQLVYVSTHGSVRKWVWIHSMWVILSIKCPCQQRGVPVKGSLLVQLVQLLPVNLVLVV